VPPLAVRNMDSSKVIVSIIEVQRTEILFHAMAFIFFLPTTIEFESFWCGFLF